MEYDRIGRRRKRYLQRHDPYRKWSGRRFVAQFRLPRKVVKRLSKAFGDWTTRTQGTDIGGGLSYLEQMCLALRFYATGATFGVIKETQNVSIATVSRCVKDVADFFYHNAARYIKWPHTRQAKAAKALRFYSEHKAKPFIFGAIDGTHIGIVAPSHTREERGHPQESVFVNRRGFYSINAMVVTDADQYITHINASFAGSANDQYCFAASPLYDEAEEGRWGNYFLLGDSGYTLKDYMVVPYDSPVGPIQRAFNRWHRSTRSLVERTIGVLKQRWRCLDGSGGYLNLQPDRACRVITACACLHNVAVQERVVVRDRDDDAFDRFRVRQEAPRGPREFNQDVPDPAAVDHRDEYAQAYFKRPARRVAPQSDEERNNTDESDASVPTSEEDSFESSSSDDDFLP